MKIYDYKGFPNPARIRIALAEKGLTHAGVEFVTGSTYRPASTKRPEFLARNPAGAVPVLELEDGVHIAECTAITEYLDHLDRQPILTGEAARERALIHMLHRRAEANLLDAAATYFHHATPGLGPHMEIYQNREWARRTGSARSPACGISTRSWAPQPYLAGERFTMADITAFAGLAYRRHRQHRGAGRPRAAEGLARPRRRTAPASRKRLTGGCHGIERRLLYAAPSSTRRASPGRRRRSTASSAVCSIAWAGEVARATSDRALRPALPLLASHAWRGRRVPRARGVFQDEHGDFPAGSYIRNPPTSSHTPRSECRLYDLRQAVAVRSSTIAPMCTSTATGLTYGLRLPSAAGVGVMPLFRDARENVRLESWPSGCRDRVCRRQVASSFWSWKAGSARAGRISRRNRGSGSRLPRTLRARAGTSGCRVWVKTGHLSRRQTAPPAA